MHRRHKNMDDGKSAQAERRQNRSSSLSLFVFLESFHHFPPSFDYSRFHNMYFYDSARNLGFILDSKLSMKKHVLKICQTAYFELKRISSIRKFLTEDATKTPVTSYILSRLDYCNCLLVGTPNSVILILQKIQTCSLGTPSPPLSTSPGKTALASHFRMY